MSTLPAYNYYIIQGGRDRGLERDGTSISCNCCKQQHSNRFVDCWLTHWLLNYRQFSCSYFRWLQCFKLCIIRHSSIIFIRGGGTGRNTGGLALQCPPPLVATRLPLTRTRLLLQSSSLTHNFKLLCCRNSLSGDMHSHECYYIIQLLMSFVFTPYP